MSSLHPQAKAVLDTLPAVQSVPTVAQSRAEVAARVSPPAPEVPWSEHRVPGAGGGQFAVRIYRAPFDRPVPVLVYFHGGGFVSGSIEGHDSLCRVLAAKLGCAVASVGYRLAPEHPFPTPMHDAYSALSWVHENADELGLDHNRVAVAGDSAGANLATVAARQAKERRGPPVRYQVLFYPVTDLGGFDTASYAEFAVGYGVTRAEMEFLRGQYLPSPEQHTHPSASPLRATNLIGLPPAFVVTAECDPLRDEGEAYARQLAEAGVPTVLKRYAGQIHGFVRMFDTIDDGRHAIAEAAKQLRPALGLD